MADLPFELQKLPQQALDVLRYFGSNGNAPSDEETLADETGLSDRGLGKAIKRLVTRKFAEMDVNRNYRLTDKGLHLMTELLDYDAEHGGEGGGSESESLTSMLAEPVERRLSLVVGEPLIANAPATVYVGLDDGIPAGEAELILQVSTLNAEPNSQQMSLPVKQGTAYGTFEITPGEFTEVRVRLQVLQPDQFSGDLHNAGGMYVDVDVIQDDEASGQLAAFGTDITILP
jgi:DNA-binding MarR family transcriptional regulator